MFFTLNKGLKSLVQPEADVKLFFYLTIDDRLIKRHSLNYSVSILNSENYKKAIDFNLSPPIILLQYPLHPENFLNPVNPDSDNKGPYKYKTLAQIKWDTCSIYLLNDFSYSKDYQDLIMEYAK